MTRRFVIMALAIALALMVAGGAPVAVARSGTVEAVVTDEAGKPVADAVVSLTPLGPPAPPPRPAPTVMDQVGKEFVPYVLPVAVGTPVSFPNRDNIRHHVYSFSPAKKFELPLYIGTPAAPVVFDKPGPVALGCNIHDWMVAHIYVVTTPHFAKTTGDGKARLDGLAAGTYEARVWHPRMRGATEKTTKPITVASDEPSNVTFALSLKPEARPVPRRDRYENQQGG